MEIEIILDKIYELPTTSRRSIIDAVTELEYTKGYRLLNADKVERNIYFIKKGIVRAYTNSPDGEVTFWFGKEGDTIVSMKSYVNNQKGYENIELLEDCVLYKLNASALNDLFINDVYIANWGRKFAEQELLKTEERLIERQFKTASERYIELIKSNPELLQRVQLSYIASYLGITQVSLSRIRAKLR
ncbi:CRP-like cAMP-binding protein [Dysgonomonas sp. PFB1-18]|uniref:Crp/Fnr family transcriptional regulator n=1 Tax=unclassified Dysgonomonas TaxID=2630389 RepID=UPI002476D892|nr:MULTISPECIES: Crp/Fnr family transcriptional regulator [unclassified Dysgonomonas]MDH6308931.1 CRP-like cAMP-binding protein [Dysgonomonas sp. PF1-14]MDH6338682.1 CRP-like cAMP-binding protein [Dysgonomonas sp. PF1-16]MDH6380290.1 CRP-like cAMP-binding protein [Dysgonomonas sp. PFB1-18]MDH6397620.1 CRP-like cAMP-binding protein [Dysgonomonas sp. PF1-23]